MGLFTFAVNVTLFICFVKEGSFTETEGFEFPKGSSMFQNSIGLHTVRCTSEPLSSVEQQPSIST